MWMPQVRWRDEDTQGHVNHIPMLEWVAQARVDYIDSLYRDDTVDYVLVHLSTDFHAKVYYPDDISVRASIRDKGKTSLTTVYELFRQDGVRILTAVCTKVFFNKKTGTAVNVPF